MDRVSKTQLQVSENYSDLVVIAAAVAVVIMVIVTVVYDCAINVGPLAVYELYIYIVDYTANGTLP